MAAYKKNVRLTLGLLNLSVDLHPATHNKEEASLKRTCLIHRGSPVGNAHVCRQDKGDRGIEEHPVSYGAWLLLGEDDEGNIRLVHENERPSPEVSSELRMIPVPTAELEAETLEGLSIFYCKPSSDSDTSLETWTLFRKGVEGGKTALVTKGVLRKGVREKLYRLTSFNGYLVLRELYFPTAISPPPEEPPAVKTNREHQDLFKQLIEMTSNDFASLNPENKHATSIMTWLKTGEVLELTMEPRKDTNELLRQMIESMKEKKDE